MREIAAFGFIEPWVRLIRLNPGAKANQTPAAMWILGVPPAFGETFDIGPWLPRATAAALFAGFSFERAARTRSLAALVQAFEGQKIPVYIAQEEEIFPNGSRELSLDCAISEIANYLLAALAQRYPD